jgi:hypothetical protein
MSMKPSLQVDEGAVVGSTNKNIYYQSFQLNYHPKSNLAGVGHLEVGCLSSIKL